MYINPLKKSRLARDSIRKQDMKQISAALKFYYAEDGNGFCPTTAQGLNQLVTKGQLKIVPKDPKNVSYTYAQAVVSGKSQFKLSIPLESPASGAGTWLWCWRSAVDSASEQITCNP